MGRSRKSLCDRRQNMDVSSIRRKYLCFSGFLQLGVGGIISQNQTEGRRRSRRVVEHGQGNETCTELCIFTTLVEDEDEVERNEVDVDLESTAISKPMWEKTTKDDRDCASYHCLAVF
ncbi:hypothetical protein Tco_0381920 [Tanacetum coccineum]